MARAVHFTALQMTYRTWVLAAVLGTGCLPPPHVTAYGIPPEHIDFLRQLRGKVVIVGAFTSADGDHERVSGIVTPEGITFEEYFRRALAAELQLADNLNATPSVTLTGTIDRLDYLTGSERWDLALSFRSSNGKSLSVAGTYGHQPGNHRDIDIRAAEGFMPAVQSLLRRAITSRRFADLLR